MKTIIYLALSPLGNLGGKFEHGWGNGYCCIPWEHPIVRKYQLECAEMLDSEYPSKVYFQIPGVSQEITYTETTKINGENYLVVGFDTAHSWNTKAQDFDWVLNETLEMQKVIEAFQA